MESGGGVLPAEEAAFQAANLLTSGPAGGVLASQKLGEQIGYQEHHHHRHGRHQLRRRPDRRRPADPRDARARSDASTSRCPSIKVTAIGAGGGSIARVADGHLTVGPESAGSEPGPACYGRGGAEPTITDADIVLGIIDPAYFLGGQMKLDVDKAEGGDRAEDRKAARPRSVRGGGRHPRGRQQQDGRPVATRDHAIRLRPAQLRDLFAYGGAGPTHAHLYGSIGGISTVVVPTTASGHSALGSVTADRHRSFSFSFGQHAPPRFQARIRPHRCRRR